MSTPDLAAGLAHAAAVTVIAAVVAVPLGFALVRLRAAWAATLAALLLPPALLPLPGAGTLVADAAAVLAFLALPPAWALRRLPPATQRIAASLAGPALVARLVWLPRAWPWALVGLGLAFARVLAGVGFVEPAALVLAVAAWPLLRVLANRDA